MTRVLVTGVTGQDGSYLAEALTARGDEVHGTVVRADPTDPADVECHVVDLTRPGIGDLIRRLRPDLVVNLAAISSVFGSWREPDATARVNGLAVAEQLAAIHELAPQHEVRFVQASSAEMFGVTDEVPQTESTPVRPTSPYGAAKAYAHGLVGAYRAAGVWAASAILYNHESPRRPPTFVTRKITSAAARIARGSTESLELGNLDARRDWGWAPDYVDALVRLSAVDRPEDLVIATGVSHSVEEFVEAAFRHAGVDDWRAHVQSSPDLRRSGDAPEHRGDASRAAELIGWRATLGFDDIVAAMVDHDLALIDRQGSAGA